MLFQPVYDADLPLGQRAGGVARLARLSPPDWRLTAAVIDAGFTERTRAVVFNNPHNPTARAYVAEELCLRAAPWGRPDVVAISDDVWEHVSLAGRRPIHMPSLPCLAETPARSRVG